MLNRREKPPSRPVEDVKGASPRGEGDTRQKTRTVARLLEQFCPSFGKSQPMKGKFPCPKGETAANRRMRKKSGLKALCQKVLCPRRSKLGTTVAKKVSFYHQSIENPP